MIKRFVTVSVACGLALLVAATASARQSDLTGTVKDRTGGVLVGARVVVMTAQRAVVATAVTDRSGAFTVGKLTDGQYLVIVQYPSLAEKQATVTIAAKPATLDVTLDVAPMGDDVTVTANPGGLADRGTLSQPVNVIPSDEILARAKTVVAQTVEGETAVHLQRTSPGMAGIFVRGLTGNKVNIFVDGVRYSNGAQRGGVNTFLDLIDASTLESVEVLRGTSSAQYGSDALGGSVQFLTHAPSLLSPGRRAVSGSATVGGETAHRGGTGNVAIGYAAPRFGVIGNFSARKSGDYRPGGGVDSHSAITRFLGLPTDRLIGERMPDTGFRQIAGQARANALLGRNTLLVASYIASRQDDANRWDQILGGDGNLISELNDLSLDLVYARLEKLNAAGFDHLSFTYSRNSQHEERVNQGGNGNPTASIAHEPETTTVDGVQVNAGRRLSDRHSVLVGGDLYFETLESVATNVNPVSGAVTPRRPRVPDQASYRQGGVFAQTTYQVTPDTLSLIGAVRVGVNRYEAKASDAPVVNGLPLWPDDSLSTTSVTFRVGASFTPTPVWTITGAVASGYRAPHMTDLGTLGLTGSGFEIAAPDLAGREAFVGTTASAAAVSTGRAVEQVGPEKSLNYEFGIGMRTAKARTRFGVFVNDIEDNIQKQALILPQGAVGTTLGGQPITQQNANGAVFVALSSTPVLVRSNFDNARIWGIEWSGDFFPLAGVTIGSSFTYMRAEDTGTHLPPNIEGGTPAPGGTVWVRYQRKNAKWWVQPYTVFALEQSRLSSLDATDRRTGAERTRTSIQNFFRNGARARGFVDSGPDGIPNNADDLLIETGETLAQVQDRVLGPGVNSSNLVTTIPAYGLAGVRVGWRGGPHMLLVDFENLGDQSYRGISWGMDGPGRGVTMRYMLRF